MACAAPQHASSCQWGEASQAWQHVSDIGADVCSGTLLKPKGPSRLTTLEATGTGLQNSPTQRNSRGELLPEFLTFDRCLACAKGLEALSDYWADRMGTASHLVGCPECTAAASGHREQDCPPPPRLAVW